jgi:predicted DCC family thiol-disulfide oxidoreductase YuxK
MRAHFTDLFFSHVISEGRRLLKSYRREGFSGENDKMERSRQAVVIFDGECVFCNRWVDFLLRFDRHDVFRFAARQTEPGASLMRQAGLPECGPGSIILVEDGGVLLRSAAVLRMLDLLGFPFSLAAVFRLIPGTPRDSIYEWFARNRLKWFGRRPTCRLPSEAERHRFL